MPIIPTPAFLIRDVKNDYSADEQQFEKHGVPFVDFGDDQLQETERERADTARKVLLKRLLYTEDHVPPLAIVMNVKGRPRAFSDVLQSLARQSYLRLRPDRVELLLIQDGANGVLDHTVLRDVQKALAAFPPLMRIQAYRLNSNGDSLGRATARNVGIWNADRERTEVIMFFDDALILDPDFIAEQMVRHKFVITPIALLGFKENRRYKTFEEYSCNGHKLQSERPNFRKDWKWEHKLRSDETTVKEATSGFDYEGQHFDSGSVISYMKLTSNFKALAGSRPIGHRALPMFFHTGLSSVTYSSVLDVGGFEKAFDVGSWSMEDSYLGLLLAVKGVKLVPCPSSVAFKVEIAEEEERINRSLHLEFNRETFWDCAAKKTWDSYNKTKLEQTIEGLWRLNLVQQVPLQMQRRNATAFGPVGESVKASDLSPSSVPGTNAIRSKGTLPPLEELEKRVRIHNRASFSDIGFSVGPNFVPVQKVYVERTRAQSIIDTKLTEFSDPDLNQIIALTGLAGSGKTSLLDHLSRRLGQNDTIPLLVRSEDLIDTDEPGYFQQRFNDFVSDDREPPSWQVLRTMCERFSDAHRSCLVLIDTVDFLITQSDFNWRSFYSLLVEVACLPNVKICMSCRPDEFEHIKTDQFYQVPLGNLAGEEIFIALNKYIDCFYERAFSEAQKKRLRQRAKSDDKFRRLIADPLKLRMLFEAYKGREIYEEEISTAKLYDRYWQVKIWSESRRAVPAHELLSRLAAYKDESCRKIAFALLVDKKLEFDEPQSIGDASDSTSRRAWSELRSDAVIHQPVATIRKYQFFHESFLEYAAARHIAASSRSSIAADWLVQHLARNADFSVAPVISHLAVLNPAFAYKIARCLYRAKTETIDPLFTKRLAIEIFTNVEEPERSAVGGYLLTASLRDDNQVLVESLVQKAGHLPSTSVTFALTLLAKVWRAKRSNRIHLLALQALADLSRVDAKSVWIWTQKEGVDVLEFNDSNRERFGTKVAIALEIFANCYPYNSELINKRMLSWYETGGEATRTAIVSLLTAKISSSSDPICEIVLRKFRDEPRKEWGIQIARAIAHALTKLPNSTIAELVPVFMKMLPEKEPLSRRATVVLGTLAVAPGQRKLFDALWKKFRSNRDQTGNLYIVFRQMAEDKYQPLIKKLKGLPIDGNAQRLELLTDCPLVPPLPLKLMQHLIDDANLRMKMALARALVKSSSLYRDAHSLLRELIEDRWSARERAYAIGAMEELKDPKADDVALLMRLYPTLDSKAKLSSARTIVAWSRTVKNDPNLLRAAADAIRKFIDDDSTAVQEAAVDALTAQNELAPVFSQDILKASTSGTTGIRLKSIQLMLPSGNEKYLLQMAKSDSDENIRRAAVLEIAKSYTSTQLAECLSSAKDGITSEKATGVLRAWCFAASSAALVDPKVSSQVICAIIRQAGLLQLSKDAQKDIGKSVTYTIHRLAQTHTEKVDEILTDLVRVTKEVLNLLPRPDHLVIGMMEGLARGLAITDGRLQAILADTTIPEICKEPIYNKQKGLRIKTQARLTELEAIIKGSGTS